MRYSLITLAFMSSTALSAVNGTNVNWSDHTNMVNNNCTGTVISAKYVLTAAHCSDLKVALRNQSNDIFNPITVEDHPNHPSDGFDVAVLTLSQRIETSDINYFADLSIDPLTNGDRVNLYGFAGSYDNLSYAKMTIDTSPSVVTERYTAEKTVNGGETQGGDSGGPWLNANQEIVAVHNASDIAGGGTDYTYGINLHKTKNFILTSINGWHYPTSVKVNGSSTITVQSLHLGGGADSAYSEGDVTITGGSCYGNGAISEFEKCTYQITASGQGKLWLSPSEYIDVNKPTSNDSTGESGGSGGSFGFWSLLALAMTTLRMRKQANH